MVEHMVKKVSKSAPVSGDAPQGAAQPRWLMVLKRTKGTVVAVAAVGAVLSGFAGYWTTYKTVASLPGSASPAAAAPLSILVLPFANQTGDESKAYVADALTTSVTSDLARIRDAYVAPVSTAFTYKTKAMTVQQIGKEAGVQFILEGSVMESGDRLRITAQLIDTATAGQIWTQVFEGKSGDLFALLDQVTTRIGNSLGEHMIVAAARKSESRKSSPNVADLILQAQAINLKPQSVELDLKVESLYRQALAQDPENVTAMINLASKLSTHASNFMEDGDPRKEPMLLEARDLALKVRAIDPGVSKVYTILGIYAEQHHEFDEARRDYEELIRLDPRNPRVYGYLAVLYRNIGEPEKALPLLKRQLDLYPHGDDVLFTNLGAVYLALGDNDTAIEWLTKALDANTPDVEVHPALAMAYANKGDMKNAAVHAAAYRQISAKYGYKGIDDSLPGPDSPPAVLKYYRERFVPEWKRAGLP
jgi:TolB-like protein/tetratricopeptide (TPR) repeat protein